MPWAHMSAAAIDDPLELLRARFDHVASLDEAKSREELRQLTQDLLTILVEKQGIVIGLQRRAFALAQAGSPDARLIQSHAEEAFAVVQRLNELRRRVTSRRAANDYQREAGARPARAHQRGVAGRHVSIRQVARHIARSGK